MGGVGTAPGANVGLHHSLFEQGARHAALDIAGKDIVNPVGILFSSVMMLRHLKFNTFADRLERSIFSTLGEGTKTKDLGGSASTTQFMDSVCA